MAYHAGPKVKEKTAGKWEKIVTPLLHQGETIWCFAAVSRGMGPQTIGLAITNARIIGFTVFEKVGLEVMADNIRRVDYPRSMTGISVVVTTDTGEINFGKVANEELGFVQYYVDYLQRAGTDSAVRDLVFRSAQHEQERLSLRDAVPVFGEAMRDKQWAGIHEHSGDGELPWLVLNGGNAGQLAAFDDRLIIVKQGGVAGFMSGSLGGGRATTFPFREITNIEYNAGMVTGVLEVLTPSYQGTGNHDFWRSSNKGRNNAADDPWTLSNCLPLVKAVYKQALPKINELQRRIIDSKQTHVVVQQAAAPVSIAQPSMAEEIQKLTDMHAQGMLDSDEFKAAKQAVIARHT